MDHSYLSERVKALQRELAVAEHNRQYFANKYPIPRTGRAIRSCGSGFIKFARFMAKVGQIKNEPKSWDDVFFPFLRGRKGS